MNHAQPSILRTIPRSLFLLFLMFTGLGLPSLAQLPLSGRQPGTGATGTATDSAGKKTNTGEWENEDATIYFTRPFSKKQLFFDSSIHAIHRRPYSQPWYRDLGNLGSPSVNLMFTPENPSGPSLGYHAFDALRYRPDSLYYYNTTRPYSIFQYNLGSKLEQTARIFHTQNIKPYWNMAVNYRKTSSPGFYLYQRNNHDNAYWTTNYTAPSLRYELYAAITYNKQQHDENGGVASDTFFSNPQFADRKTIPVNFFASGFGTTRSPVSNLQRDITVRLDHAYTWGRKDTTYNEDSTAYEIKLTPRFRIQHKMEISGHRYQFKDKRPDSLRYSPFFAYRFASADSVFTRQEWTYADNSFLLNGLLGKSDNQLVFNAGVGTRVDKFTTYYLLDDKQDDIISNYLLGSLSKEVKEPGQWEIDAFTRLYLTGSSAGSFELNGSLGKDLGKWGAVRAGAGQQLNTVPYSFTTYQNQFWSRNNSFSKESITNLYVQIASERYQLSAGARNYLLSNYLYFSEAQAPVQASATFSLAQVWLRKLFRFGHFTLDNELLYQQATNNAPVNVPKLMGRHQFAIETFIFKRQLQIASGIEVRYHSDYYPPGYSPFFNRFYYQQSYYVSNAPDASVFFNFRIKRFRAYVMFDQVPQLFQQNLRITRGYAAQNAMLRFGFSWVMVN